MTEKRFRMVNHGEYDYGLDYIMDNYKRMPISDVCDLLNELHEENMMLKGEVAHYKLILMSLEEQARRLSEIHCVGDKE